MAPAPTSTITTTETIIVVATSTTNTMGRGTMIEGMKVTEVQGTEDMDMVPMDNMEMVMVMAIDMAFIVITRVITRGNAVKPGALSSTHKPSSLTAASMDTRSTTGRPWSLQNVTAPTGKEVIAFPMKVYFLIEVSFHMSLEIPSV